MMNTPLKILFAAPGYKPAYHVGGPIFSVSALAEALVRKGHFVTVFTTNGNMREDLDVPGNCPQMVDGVEVWYFQRQEILKKVLPFVPYLSQSIGYLYAPAMSGQLRKTVPSMDVVHAHLPFIYPTFAAARAARAYHKPFFYHQRGVLCPDHLSYRSLKKKLYIQAIERPILERATTLIALTEYGRDGYRKLGIDTPCRVIPNGIDPDQYLPQCPLGEWAGLKFDADASVILFLARLHPMKGIDRLIDAFVRVQKGFPKAVLVIAGPDEYGLLPQWQQKVNEAGLNDRILFPGNMTGEGKRRLLARADLFCLPSDAEGFSMTILEALASGTAVMISPGCHFPEVEKAGVGKVVEADPEAMAKALAGLLADRSQLKDMGKRAREFVVQGYSWDRVADQVIDMYRDGIARCARAGRA